MNLLPFLTELPKKQLFSILAAALSLCLITAMIFHETNKEKVIVEDLTKVRTITIQNSKNAQGYTYAGEVRGRYESQLAFQVNGKIIKRNVELGSRVNAGDVLMQIDAKDIQQTVRSNSAQMASADSQLKLAENNLSRYQQLLNQGAISQSMYDEYVNAYNVAAAGREQASAQYAQGTNQLEYSLLRADKAGIVSSITAEMGQVVSAGQIVVTVVQDGEQEVEINVPENRMQELQSAGQIKASFWALPGVTVDGTIREIAPMADAVTRTFKVRIALNHPPAKVKLGMTASIQLKSSSAQPAVTIPLAAVYQDGSSPAVWIVKDNVLTLQPITTGNFGNGTVEVFSGLSPGDCIVSAGVHKLKEGQKVKTGGDSL